jgi:hypothetical protein
MRFLQTMTIFALAVFAAACKGPRADLSRLPLTIVFVEGDDGLVTNTLQIVKRGNHLAAVETETDDYSQPGLRGVLRSDSLVDRQLRALKSFLEAVEEAPANCGQTSGFIRELSIRQSGYQKILKGECAGGTASYNSLHAVLFGKGLY